MEYKITDSNIKIIDSAFVPKKDFRSVLEQIQGENPEHQVVKSRFFYSAICEWSVHNLLYSCHLFRSHTKDVDINLLKWYGKVMYFVVGTISWLFIK